MKRPKNRLNRVIVIGATPAGVAAATKLGELGVPVSLIDHDFDLDRKLSHEDWRLESGVPFNFANRPGLLRLLRNPSISCILPAEVISIKHSGQGFSVKLKTIQTFIDPDRCTLCGRCVDICPVITPDGRRPLQISDYTGLPGRPVIDKGPQPLCQKNCPLGVNAQGYIALARAGRFREALELVRRDNILPGICGRVCTHPCEAACRRADLDSAISIRNIKRFLADYELEQENPAAPEIPFKRNEKIAVIGSGPAGLAAAADLARLGYPVTVFEKEDMAGGLLRYGIGRHRLPAEILDAELSYIQKLGVRFKTSHNVDLQHDLETVTEDFDSVILTTGAWSDRKLGVPGEDLEGVEGCISFLTKFRQGQIKTPAGRVAVIGDGNAAFDLARVLKRVGAEVTILSWFPESLIPADPEEIRGAKEEGIVIKDCTQTIAFSGKDGKLDRLTCRPTKPGPPDANGVPWPVIVEGSDPFEVPFDYAFVAIGQKGPFSIKNNSVPFNVTHNGFIEVDDSSATATAKIYAAGDGVTGPSSVVNAMANGRAAARAVHRAISGKDAPSQSPSRPTDRDFPEIPEDIPSLARPEIAERQPAARCDNFKEVSLGLNQSQVLLEAERCLQCGICSECLLCLEACSAIGAVRHQEQSEEFIENAGVIIVADPESSHFIKGEDVIRAYGPKAAGTDVNAMVTRGYAAAASAMNLLGGMSQKAKGHGVSVPHPDPELSPEIRVGVFVCRCNDTFGWTDAMDEHILHLTDQPDVIHAEAITSACVPEGSANILRTIRAKGITRVVLASCVCCPLDFFCSACTDQRSRLKHALFKGAEVSRSMVETCNLRGEVLRLLKYDTELAMNAFSGLIKRSIHRAKRLRQLPNPARTYNFATAVIGESEASVNSALTLAEAGFEVLLFGTPDKPLAARLDHLNIHCFDNSAVTRLYGNLGNFQILFEAGTSGNPSQTIQVGAVIISEKFSHKLPYTPQEHLLPAEVVCDMQKTGQTGIPFFYPGNTSIKGLFVSGSSGVHVSDRKKGAAAAALAAAVMPKGPRPSKGYTVVVDKNRCRGCGRCIDHCPYHAIVFNNNSTGGWYAQVDEAVCKGCGNCISVCPTNAADSPYRNQSQLEQMIEEVLAL